MTPERLRELLHYDPETGVFTWKVRTTNSIGVGDVAGTICKGYLRIKIDGWTYAAHRLAWLYVHGVWPKEQIDHRNRIKTNNWIDNLREATQSINMQNRQARADSATGLLGSFHHGRKFRAQISLNGASIHLGIFPTAELAHAAYLAAKARLHPGFLI